VAATDHHHVVPAQGHRRTVSGTVAAAGSRADALSGPTDNTGIDETEKTIK